MTMIDFQETRRVALAVLESAGVPPPHAALQVDLLLEAELRGRASHGLLRLKRIVERIRNRVVNPLTKGSHRWRGNVLEVDGCMGLGPVVAVAALEKISERAAATGVAVAAIRNNNHIGMLAWYADRIARQGQIAVALCNSEALVHPWNGRRAMQGTNPFAIGIPLVGEPFVLDMATSLVSMGEIHHHANLNRPIPSGWALDASGEPTTDAHAAKRGAIAPFGGAKGYSLGLGFEVLIGALTACALGPEVHGTLDSDQPCNKGDVFIVIDPGADQGRYAAIESYLDAVRASGSPDAAVQVPGDRALASRRERLTNGLPVDDQVWHDLQLLAASRQRD
jgi:LDH2 family malate/lactate/ureidoglycolate dehydrogenase